MTKPKIKPKTKSKQTRRQRKDKHAPENMNTKQLYLIALDYKKTGNQHPYISDTPSISFSDIVQKDSSTESFYNYYEPYDDSETNLLYSKLENEEEFVSPYDSTDFYKELSTIYCKDASKIKIEKSSINRNIDKNINKNIIKKNLLNIKKSDAFYSL